MKERLLLLNNNITIGLFIQEVEIGQKRLEEEKYLKQPLNRQHVIMILLSRNGRYFRLYDNAKLASSHEAIMNPVIFKLSQKNYSQNHVTEYCPQRYLPFIQKVLQFRNIYLLNHEEIYWSERLFSVQSNVVSTEKVLELSKKSPNRHWIITPSHLQQQHLHLLQGTTEDFHSPRKHVTFMDERDMEWTIIAEDVLAPQSNNLSICPYHQHVRLAYTLLIKEDDHHLYDHYLQHHINEIGTTSTSKKKKNDKGGSGAIDPYLPGYYEYEWITVIPLDQVHHHALISKLVTKLFVHYELLKNDYPMEFDQMMWCSSDHSSNYGQEMKELESISPYLNPLIASTKNEEEESEERVLNEEEVEGLYRQRDRDHRYPVFNTLPFFITKERCDGFDYSHIFPADMKQLEANNVTIIRKWVLSLVNEEQKSEKKVKDIRDDDNNDIAAFRSNQLEVWAIPSQLITQERVESSQSDITAPPFSGILMLIKELFHLFHFKHSTEEGVEKQNQQDSKVHCKTLHTNMMSHLLLTSQMSDHEANRYYLHNKSWENLSVTWFRRFLPLLPRMIYYYQYLQEITPIATHYYQKYYHDHYQIRLHQNHPPTSNVFLLQQKQQQQQEQEKRRKAQNEGYWTEEHVGRGYKYTVIVAPNTPTTHRDYRNIVKIQANYSAIDCTILHYYIRDQRFEVLFPNGQEASFFLHEYHQQLGIFSMVKYHLQQGGEGLTKTRFEEDILALIPKLEQLLVFAHWAQYTELKRKEVMEEQQAMLRQAKAVEYQNYLQQQFQQIQMEFQLRRQRKRELEKRRRRIKVLLGEADSDDSDSEDDGKQERKNIVDGSDGEVEDDEEEDEVTGRMNEETKSTSTVDLDATFTSPYRAPLAKTEMGFTETPDVLGAGDGEPNRTKSIRRVSVKDKLAEITSNYENELKDREMEMTGMKHFILSSVQESLDQSEKLRQRNAEYLRLHKTRVLSLCEE